MVEYCLEYQKSQNKMSKREMKDLKKNQNMENLEKDEADETWGEHRAYICPNAGSNNNLSSNKQRLIFMEIDRNDVYSVLDVGKVADIVLMVMSASNVDETQLKIDPDKGSHAIDE